MNAALSNAYEYGNPKAVAALAESAKPRLGMYKTICASEKIAALGLSAFIPPVMYAMSILGNSLLGVDHPSPLSVSIAAGISISPTPLFVADGIRLYNGRGHNLSYNSHSDLVAMVNDSITDKWHGFEPLLLGERPFLLRQQEAQIMPVRTYLRLAYCIEATVDDFDAELIVPDGVIVNQNSEGIGAIKRNGKRGFKILAFAPYDSFM
jgi:hypothetical protein